MLTSPALMLILTYGLLLFFSLKGVKKSISSSNEQTFLCRANTDWLRGIAIIFIVYSHYIGLFDVNYLWSSLGFLGVSIFFLMSGYGLMCSKLNKPNYTKNFIPKKLIRIYAPFVIAFALAIIIFFVCGFESKNNILLELVTLSLPNTTNWYLKVQMIMYILFYVCALVFKNKSNYALILALFILGCIYILIGYFLDMEWFWYQNVLYFPLGMLLALKKDFYYKVINKKYLLSIFISLCFFVFGFALVFLIGGSVFLNMIFILSFVNLVLVFMGKMCGNSKLLKLCGRFSLEIYLSHKIVLYILNLFNENNLLYFIPFMVVSILTALAINYLSKFIISGIEKLLNK